jgi:iron complex transport system substrate-binding protein
MMYGVSGFLAAALLVLLVPSCKEPGPSLQEVSDPIDADTSVIVFGPSLVEVFFDSGEGWRIVGVDRFSLWPPAVSELPDVGGYIDASFENIASLDPTSIHTVGHNLDLEEVADELGIPYHSYSFDTLDDVFCSVGRIEELYGSSAGDFRDQLQAHLDSIRTSLGGASPSILLVVYHQPGSSSMTVAGRNTFLADLVSALDCSLAAPDHGTYPSISVEGVLDLAPDRIICLYPDAPDTQAVAELEVVFWQYFGFGPREVHVLFDDYLLIPGSRMGQTAERIAGCLL